MFSLQGTYLLKWEQQLEAGGEYYNALGVYSQDLDFPAFRWQHVIMAGWNTRAVVGQPVQPPEELATAIRT